MSNFNSKEEYQYFVSAWKSAASAEECKSKRLVCDHKQYNWKGGYSNEEQAVLKEKGYDNVERWSYTIKDGGHYKEYGWLNASHYLFRNVMLGKDPRRGFSPKSEKKCSEYETPWDGYNGAVRDLGYAVKYAQTYIDDIGKGKAPQSGTWVKQFLEPFQGALAPADLIKIDMEKLRHA